MEEEKHKLADISGLKAREEERRQQVEFKKDQTESVLREKQKLLRQAQETYNHLQVGNFFIFDVKIKTTLIYFGLFDFRESWRKTTCGPN